MIKPNHDPDIEDLSDIFTALRPVFVDAGKIAMEYFQNTDKQAATLKQDGSIVTQGDLAVSAFLVEKLGRLFPEIPVVSEESESHELKNPDGYYWLTDPIDGTANFAAGTDGWAILASLQHKREQIFSIIHSPLRQEFFWACKNGGAYYERIVNGLFKTGRITGNPWEHGAALTMVGAPVAAEKIPDQMNIALSVAAQTNFEIHKTDHELYAHHHAAMIAGAGHLSLGGLQKIGPSEWDLAAKLIIEEAGGAMFSLLPPHEIRFGNPAQKFYKVVAVSDAHIKHILLSAPQI